MVHLSTVVIAALAIVPALATQVSDFEARDTQDLDVRGTKSTRSFDDFDLEVRDKSKRRRKNANRQNHQQPQRQSTGLSTSAGRLLGTTINTALNGGGGERRAFFDEEDLEAREGEKRRRRRRSRKQRLQAQPQTTEGGEQTAGTTRDLEDFDLEARFDFEDLEFEARMDSEDLESRDKSKRKRKNANHQNHHQRQQPQRQSTGLSTSAGRLLGTTINTALNGGGERRDFIDEDLEVREGEKRRRRRRSRKQRLQAQPQTTEGGEQTAGSTRDFDDVELEARTRRSHGLSASAGRFVGSTIHSALNGGERRDFVDEDGLDARNNESKRRRRRARKQRKLQQQQPQTTEGQTTGTGETREFVDEDFMLEAREIDELD